MNIKYIDVRFAGKIKVTEELLNYLRKHRVKSIALFASVQFLNLDNFIQDLEKEGFEIMITKAKRTQEKIQILGCDCYPDSFEENLFEADTILYIGDGTFHPTALLFAQLSSPRIKSVTIFNPQSNKISFVEFADIEQKATKIKVNVKKFIASEKIGIFVSSKSGQYFFNLAQDLKHKLENENKKVFVFVGDNFNSTEMENFNFIECWVNCACPRIGTDDILNVKQPVVNIKDALEPIKALSRF